MNPLLFPSVLLTHFRCFRRLLGGRWSKCSFGWARPGGLERADEHWANCEQLKRCAYSVIENHGVSELPSDIENLRRSLLYLDSKGVFINL
jgi:hypothetical protein